VSGARERERAPWFPRPGRVAVSNELIWIGRAAIKHSSVAIIFEFFWPRGIGRAQRSHEFVLVPRTEEDVVTPLCLRIPNAVLGKGQPLLDGGYARHIAKTTGMRTADRCIEGLVGYAFVDEIVRSNDRPRLP